MLSEEIILNEASLGGSPTISGTLITTLTTFIPLLSVIDVSTKVLSYSHNTNIAGQVIVGRLCNPRGAKKRQGG